MRHHPFVLAAVLVPVLGSCTGGEDAATTSPPAATVEVEVTRPPAGAVTTSPAPTASPRQPVGVFSFADDDLCDWLSPERVAELVEAEYEWSGTATERSFSDLPDGCTWTLSGTPDVPGLNTVSVGSAQAPNEPFLEFDEFDDAQYVVGIGVRGHPALSDGVIFAYGAFGYAAFGVPAHGYVQVYLWVPGNEGSEDARFAFADAVIRELGWTR